MFEIYKLTICFLRLRSHGITGIPTRLYYFLKTYLMNFSLHHTSPRLQWLKVWVRNFQSLFSCTAYHSGTIAVQTQNRVIQVITYFCIRTVVRHMHTVTATICRTICKKYLNNYVIFIAVKPLFKREIIC